MRVVHGKQFLAAGRFTALWTSLALAQESPVVPELPRSPIEKVFREWVTAREPMKAVVEIRQIAKNGSLELQAAGEVRVLAQDTVHYRLRESSPRYQATDSKPSAAEFAVDFYRRGPAVVILSNGSPRKVALSDCRAGEARTPVADGGGSGLTVLEAAVGGTEGEARARARLVQWVVFIADPRRIHPERAKPDLDGYGGSKIDVYVPIPLERRIALTSAVQVNDASLSLSASPGGSVAEALVRLHCAGNMAEQFSDHYFDTSIGYLRIDKATELDVPPDVEALLQPAAAGK